MDKESNEDEEPRKHSSPLVSVFKKSFHAVGNKLSLSKRKRARREMEQQEQHEQKEQKEQQELSQETTLNRESSNTPPMQQSLDMTNRHLFSSAMDQGRQQDCKPPPEKKS